MLWSSPERCVQNHAEFVSIRTVGALAYNAQIAVGKIDARQSLLEILGIDQTHPTDALRRALVLRDEVWYGCSSVRVYR